MPQGALNCPGALPRLPHVDRNLPSLVNFCIRWLRLSTMYRTSWRFDGDPRGARELAVFASQTCPSDSGICHPYQKSKYDSATRR